MINKLLYSLFATMISFSSIDTNFLAMKEIIEITGEIPDEEISLSIEVNNVHRNSNNHIIQVDFLVEFEWIDLPTWRLDDPIVISFDDDIFYYSSSTALYHESRYKTSNGEDLLYYTVESAYHNNNTLTWDTALKPNNVLGIGGKVVSLYGYATFSLLTKGNYTSINSNVSFDYYHSLYSNSIITLNSPIGYTMSGSYDKATASCSISL